MALAENIKNGVEFIGETVVEIASSIAEKNRLRVQLNHIKALIKTDSATRDQAYIELGRFFYENLRDGASPENEAICAVIDAASDRISAASVKYMELLNLQNETKIRSENAEKIKKIVSEKAAASAKVAKEKGAELSQKAKEKGAELGQKAKDAAADLKDKATETIGTVKDRFSPERNAELEALIAEEDQKVQEADAAAVEEAIAEAAAEAAEDVAEAVEDVAEAAAPAAPAEESPDDFEF